MKHVSFACADCLEEAGGRQQRHNIFWHVEICPCCGKHRATTDPLNFGNPKLTPCLLEVTIPERKEA